MIYVVICYTYNMLYYYHTVVHYIFQFQHPALLQNSKHLKLLNMYLNPLYTHIHTIY